MCKASCVTSCMACALVALIGCSGEGSDSSTEDVRFYPPDRPGPFAVGNVWYLMVDPSRWDRSTGGERRIPVEVWYPVDPGAADRPEGRIIDFIHEPWTSLVVQVFSLLLPPEELENLYKPTGSIPGAPVARASGPFPLIVFSHGNGGTRFQNYTLACHLASHGFIVAAPDHTENAAFTALPDTIVVFNPFLMSKSFEDRPKDMRLVIDSLLELSSEGSGDLLEGVIDSENIGGAGHSFGGQTVMNEVQVDERIDAGLNLAGPWISLALFNLHVPMMYMIGTEDKTVGVPYNPFIVDTYRHSPAPRFLLEFPDGGHFTFTDACGIAPTLFGKGDGCGQGKRYEDGSLFEFVDPERAQRIQHAYSTAFFSLVLKGDTGYREYLCENRFPSDITYQFAF